MKNVTIEELRNYWNGKRIPQQWYSNKKPLSLQWFNEISYKRYNVYYQYYKYFAEFEHHQGERILEIGCGLGTDTVEYAKNGAKVNAIDLGEEQINLTKLNLELRNLKYESIEVGNAENLKFDDNTFDLVSCFGVIHHTTNPELAVREIFRVLKDDGQALITLYSRGWKHYLKRCLIQGIIKGKIFKYNFNWIKLYSDISETYGGSPKTLVMTKKDLKKLFKDFEIIYASKDRLGEFFEYKPYNTIKFPNFFQKTFNFFSLEKFLGENWRIKLKKQKEEKGKLADVIFKHY